VSLWSNLSTEFLRAELARRDEAPATAKPECGSGVKGNYNTPVHVGALILILVLSTVGMESVLTSIAITDRVQLAGFLLYLDLLNLPDRIDSYSSRSISVPVFLLRRRLYTFSQLPLLPSRTHVCLSSSVIDTHLSRA
jgi:hypothetical protein